MELVFAFFANPANLPHLMPRKFETRIEDARIEPPPPRPVAADESRRFKSVAAGVGSEILISFYPIPWVPRRVSWLARITEFEWNSHFCDAQVRGPFTAFNHRHGIRGGVSRRAGGDAGERCGGVRAALRIDGASCRRDGAEAVGELVCVPAEALAGDIGGDAEAGGAASRERAEKQGLWRA